MDRKVKIRNIENMKSEKLRIGNQRNLILSKTKWKLKKKIVENYSREKLFSKKDDQDGIQIKEYYFQNEPNPR